VRNSAGLTLVEVILAISVLAVVVAGLTVALAGYLRQNVSAGKRSEAAQIINYLGRRVMAGDPDLRVPSGSNRIWDYGTLGESFPDLVGTNTAQPGRYRAEIANLGSPDWATDLGLELTAYRIRVCWRHAGQTSCAEAYTLGRPPGRRGPVPPLPGVN